jgi:uncharacterized membrane protein YphA (DoxX/SURF4 family)
MVDRVSAAVSLVVSGVLFIAGPGKVAAPSRLATTLGVVAGDRISTRAARTAAQLMGLTETLVAVLLATALWPEASGALLAALGRVSLFA